MKENIFPTKDVTPMTAPDRSGNTVSFEIDPSDLLLDKSAHIVAACWTQDIKLHQYQRHTLHFETLAIWMDELVAACLDQPTDDLDEAMSTVKFALVTSPWHPSIRHTEADGSITITIPETGKFHTIFAAYEWISNTMKSEGDLMVLSHANEAGETVLELTKRAQAQYQWTPVDF